MNTVADPLLKSTSGHWQAGLKLGFEQVSREGQAKTILRENTHFGPLSVQKPFYPEGPDVAHVYPLHPPGGIVSGDQLNIDVMVANKAHALMTTPGAGRVYRARPDRAWQCQSLKFKVGQHAKLEWLPLETIVFPDAQARLSIDFDLHKQAKLVCWEVTSLGLPASKAQFDTGALDQTINIRLGGRLALREKLLISNFTQSILHSLAGFQGMPVCGLMVAGPIPLEQRETLIEALREQAETLARPHLLAFSQVGHFLTARYLGNCSETARKQFELAWNVVRPVLLGRPACSPRIWRT